MPQPPLPAPLAPRPEPGAQLLEAVRQRQAELSLQLAQHWVHRRGVVDLQRFCDRELAPAEGAEAVAWLQGLLGLDQPVPSPTAASAASPPGSPALELPPPLKSADADIAVIATIDAEQVAGADSSDWTATPDGEADAAGLNSEPDPAAPEIHFEPPQLPDLQALDSELQARAVAAVDEAFAALAQSFEEAARLTAPQSGASVSLPSFSGEAPVARTLAPEPMPVRVGLWPSLRASAASLGSRLRPAAVQNTVPSEAAEPPVAATPDAPTDSSAEAQPSPVAGERPALPQIQTGSPAQAEPSLTVIPAAAAASDAAEATAAAAEGMETAATFEAVTSGDAALLSETAATADADADSAVAGDATAVEAAAAEAAAAEAATADAAAVEAAVVDPDATDAEGADPDSDPVAAGSHATAGQSEELLAETADSAATDALSAPRRVGLLGRLRRRLSRGRLSRLRSVMRDCVEETLALLRSPEPVVSDDEPGFEAGLPEPQPLPQQTASRPESQALQEASGSPSWPLSSLEPPSIGSAASEATEPLQATAGQQPQPRIAKAGSLSWTLEPAQPTAPSPAARKAALPQPEAASSAPQSRNEQTGSPFWSLEPLQPASISPAAGDAEAFQQATASTEPQLTEQEDRPFWPLAPLQPPAADPAASEGLEPPSEPAPRVVPLATVRSIAVPRPAAGTDDSPAAPLPAAAPVVPLEAPGRKRSLFSDRPAPAPSALSDLRAWLPDRRDELPRAS